MSSNLFLLSNPIPWIILVFFLSVFVSSFPSREKPGCHDPYCAHVQLHVPIAAPTQRGHPLPFTPLVLTPCAGRLLPAYSPVPLLWVAVSFLHLSLLPQVGFLSLHTRMLLPPPSLVNALFTPIPALTSSLPSLPPLPTVLVSYSFHNKCPQKG